MSNIFCTLAELNCRHLLSGFDKTNMMNKIRYRLLAAVLALLAVNSTQAQLRINFGEDSPLRKLSIAEMAISNLYVDSVDEGKLAEDAIRGMLETRTPAILLPRR